MEIKNASHLKNFMRNHYKTFSVNSGMAYTYYFCRQFLARLFKTNPDYLSLIGSFAQVAYMGNISRPVTDIDMRGETLDTGIDVVKEAIEDSKNDAIVFNLQSMGVTQNNTAIFKIDVNYEKVSRVINVDVTSTHFLSLEKRKLATILEIDKPFTVNTITLEEHLGRKLCIICERLYWYREGKPLRRIKDFFDVNMILRHKGLNLDEVFSYFAVHMDSKGLRIDPNIIGDDFIATHLPVWQSEAKAYEFKEESFFESVTSVKNLLTMATMQKGKSR